MEYNLTAIVKSRDSLFEFKNKIKNIGDIYGGCLICRNISYMMLYIILWYSWNLLAKAILCTNSTTTTTATATTTTTTTTTTIIIIIIINYHARKSARKLVVRKLDIFINHIWVSKK